MREEVEGYMGASTCARVRLEAVDGNAADVDDAALREQMLVGEMGRPVEERRTKEFWLQQTGVASHWPALAMPPMTLMGLQLKPRRVPG